MKEAKNKSVRIQFVIVTIVIIVITALFFLPNIMYKNTSFVCGEFKTFSYIRKSEYVKYSFLIEGTRYEGKMNTKDLSEKDKNEMMESDCLTIEVSNIWRIYNRVVKW